MNSGVSHIENTIISIIRAKSSLSADIRFLPFRYIDPDYESISTLTRKQMQKYLNSLMSPLYLVSDCTLHLSENVVITPSVTIFNETPSYYPSHFYVAGLTYEEWMSFLDEKGSGFLPVMRITVDGNSTYDALIYSIPWANGSHLYACMNIYDIKQAVIDKSDMNTYYLTLTDSEGTCLYTDLPDEISDICSFTQAISSGNLVITVHIPEAVLTEQMHPLYVFLGLYLTLCVIVLVIIIYIGVRFSSRPMLKIINMLEGNSTQTERPDGNKAYTKQTAPLQYGFLYIQNKVHSYENSLAAYQNTIETQTKVLQARFLEKALHGSLATEKDYEQFRSYFPDFPECFCLIQLGLQENSDGEGTLYPDALSLIQIYMQNILPNTYHQQLDSTNLLIIVSKEFFDECSHTINYLMDNINREEPSYHVWAIASKFYCHPKSIPSGYWQIQDLRSYISLDTHSQLCTVSDYQYSRGASFRMADAISLQSAITYGNKEVALLKLQTYSDSLLSNNCAVFEMLRSILLCIKQDYAGPLLDISIPSYCAGMNMYTALEEAISGFCEVFQTIKQQNTTDCFAKQVKDYIDCHFAEDDLCHAKLAEYFQCSASKIHKAFTKEFDLTVSNYIEKKRMELAAELLSRGEDTVVEVARKCGFTNYNTFIKAYRRVFGDIPSAMKA